MTRQDEILENAIQSLRNDELDTTQVSDSARRVASRLGIEALTNSSETLPIAAIANCEDVQRLLKPWRAHQLPESRTLMIEAHLRDCGPCYRLSRNTEAKPLDWTTPQATSAFTWRPKVLGWFLAPTLALLAVGTFVYQAYWQVPPGVRAEVISIDGSASRISESGDRPLAPGDKLTEGDELRTSGGAHAVLRLTDGSMVEINERSMLGIGARGRSMTVTLDNGGVIVQAAKRTSGHLYVNTPDSRLAVTGTVFSVNSGIKGSRVAVLQGSVHMIHAGLDTTMQAGDQLATYDNLNQAPVQDQIAQQISWSQDREKYLPLLAQFAVLQHKLESIPFPRPRYSSDLLEHVPADTLLYISIPNLGDYLSEANKVFQDQLKQSPVLAQWWDRGHAGNNTNPTTDLNSLIAKLHQMSEYLGDEVVVVGVRQADKPGFAVISDLRKPGLDDFLRLQMPTSASGPGLTILDESSLASTSASSQNESGGYAVIGQHQAIFSNNIATLKQIHAQLAAGSSGFAAGNFGRQITAAYTRGAGVILAADLHEMIASQPATAQQDLIDRSGMRDVEFLVAEHRELNGLPQNHLNVTFSGPRQRVASWLAAPAPVGSLSFVTPNAALVVAALSKDPRAIADDLLAMAVPDENRQHGLAEVEAKLQINFRDDVAANLGGDFLLALDGPVLPMPSWKAVIEVRNPEQLESTLERLTQSISSLDKNAHTILIQPSDVSGQRFYAIIDQTLGRSVANYTFSEGYMIVAPDRALLIEALRTQSSGDSLARSATFKASLPKDENENYSAIAYQNLNPVLAPLLSQLSGESAQAIQQLAADARPTTVCAWGRDNHIEAASDSHLFGFEFLTLGTLMHSGNNKAIPNVRD